MTEETGRRGPVLGEIGSECVLKAGRGSERWREGKREVREGRRGEMGCECWRRSRESVCSQAPLFTQRGEASPTSSEVAQPQKISPKTIRRSADPFR